MKLTCVCCWRPRLKDFPELGEIPEKGGWQLSQDASLIGSYDAIRVYLWVGMMNDNDPQKARLLARFKPMATTTIKQGLPPEKVDVATGKRTGDGPVGFSASLLPFYKTGTRRRCNASTSPIVFR